MTSPSASTKLFWLALGFGAAFFVIGASHWPIPYAKVSLPSSLIGPGLFLVSLAAVAARLFGRASFLSATLVVGSAAPAAILARVIVETSHDPTSHNLWPIELILGAVVGLACSAGGALIASLYATVVKKP